MNRDDQFFRAGEKVCRVADGSTLGISSRLGKIDPIVGYGIVLCVSECGPCGDGWNGVNFVGVLTPSPCRWKAPAAAFRRIEEIQLCVRAAEKFKQPQTEIV